MKGMADLAVLRLGHRPGRDERMTTHVGLTARALGADSAVLADEAASQAETIEEITDRFGGPFDVRTTDEPMSFIEHWDGSIVHLTMYGLPVQDEIGEVRNRFSAGSKLLVVVGAEKVPFDVYELADWNLAVTNQPHSEVASLAIFLDRLYEGAELERGWTDADRRVIPQAEGKRLEETTEAGNETDTLDS